MYAFLLAHNADESATQRLALQRAGFAARVTTDLKQAIQDWQEQPSDLVLLSFRDQIPFEEVRSLRGMTEAPFMVVTNPIDEDQHVDLLDAGVDLVIFRPFSTRLLIAQLRGLLRRLTGLSIFNLPNFNIGDLSLDPSTRTVQVEDGPAKHLTRLEFRLLYTLAVHAGQVLPVETLVEHVWGYSGRGDRDLVRGLIKRLRNKVEPAPQTPCYIVTVPGVGYKLQKSANLTQK